MTVYRIYNRSDLEKWERRRILFGYNVICEPNSCDYCKSLEGFHWYRSGKPAPPFHNGCGCVLVDNWAYDGVYDEKSGKITHPECNRNVITAKLNSVCKNKGLSRNLSWNEIAFFGYYNTENGKIEDLSKVKDIKDIAGYETVLCDDTVKNVDGNGSPDTLDYWIDHAVNFAKDFTQSYKDTFWFLEKIPLVNDLSRYLVNTISSAILSWDNSVYDLKKREDTCFGKYDVNGARKYWGFIWNNDLLYYDEPGNIVIGALAGAMDFSWFYTVFGANLYSGSESLLRDLERIAKLQMIQGLKPDDPRDIANFEIGWKIGQSRI